ncbi:MAG TPA: FxSxx-COOH system tetratricopeptide repeat protein [Streptosporangiaceae bacterium]|jgi:CO dehydrogenase nickel-insertion accessory protein CooC1
MSESSQGQIITFYSYKGGTGRTMALANVAWILASNGKRVLIVDWDLESPGLHKFFHPFLDQSTVSATPGVIEIINDYASAALDPEPRDNDWHLQYAHVERHAVSLDWVFPDNGKLDFLSAGRQNRDYSAAVCSLDWDNFYDRLGGGRFFRAMREDMRQKYDYVLIDSRTGLSDVADICTIELPDVLTICFTLSDQSIEGAANVARQISGRYRDRNIRVLPVPMRIEDGEKEKLDIGRSLARMRFEGFPAGMSPESSAMYWASVEVPYKPFYAFEETLATFGDDPGSPASLLSSFERITDALTEGRVTTMRPIPENLRLQYKEAYARRQPASSTQVYLSYVPEDRMWADWIEAVLTRAGFRVLPRSTVTTAAFSGDARGNIQAERELAAAPQAIAILSLAYLNSPAARSIWKTLSAADAAGTHRQLVPVRVSDVRISEPFTDHPMADLARLDAAQATAKLLWALGRAPQSAGGAGGAATEPRFPGTIPPIWNVPARNADFTGRGAMLELLRDKLAGTGMAVVVPQALYGLGGVGKTQLALEYAHRFMADYDLVWWVPSERAEETIGALAELARKMGLKVGDNVSEAAEAALEELRRDTSPHWLLIFDNADDPKQLEPYLPAGAGHVLITSRNQAWSHSAEPLEVDVFTRDESVAHLLRHVPELDMADAKRVADALGHLPLAVEQASAWLEQTGMPARAYVEQLATQSTKILALNQPPDYPMPVVATWNLSFERLKERSPAAVRLLQLCAFFSPGPISMDLLYSDEMNESLLPFDETLSEKLMLGRVIRDISRFALVKVDQGSNSLQIHRLVQAVIRSQMSEQEQEGARHEVHKILAGARPRQGETDDPANWSTYDIIWPHLGPSRAEDCDDPRTRQLLIDWVRYQWKHGEFESGLSLARRLETVWTHQLGPDHQQTLHLQFQIANILRSLGRFGDARDLDTYVLDRQRAVLGTDHPHALMTANGLGADLRALGDFSEALGIDRQTYESFKDQFGDDYPRTLAAAHNLACSLRLMGDCFAARRLDEETLDRQLAVLGRDHPNTLLSAASLAHDMRAAGAFRESVNLLRDTWDKYREVIGDDMTDTLRTATSLALSLRKAGEQAEAMNLAQDIYDRYKRRYGSDAPDAQSCALNLACDYAAVDDIPQALELITGVKTVLQVSLGDDHPNTLVATNNLACYLRVTGELGEALALTDDTLRRLRRKLGSSHPLTLSCAVNLANCRGDSADLAASEELQRETIVLLTQTLGAGHPDTLVCEANLAVTLRQSGREQDADELRTRVITDFARVLGAAHPDVVQLQKWQRINRDLEPQQI